MPQIGFCADCRRRAAKDSWVEREGSEWFDEQNPECGEATKDTRRKKIQSNITDKFSSRYSEENICKKTPNRPEWQVLISVTRIQFYNNFVSYIL